MHDENATLAKKEKYLQKIQMHINRADAVTAISHFAFDEMKKYLVLDDSKCSVIYNGCSISDSVVATPPARRPTGKFLFTIGTIVPKKNFHVLPALLVNNDYKLVISGVTQSDSYKHLIEKQAALFGVQERIQFTGPVSEPEKYWYMQNCEAFLFPSLAEGFGLPVVEAMHFSKPVLLSTCASLPEVGGNAAYYFSSFEPASMQDVLASSLQNYNAQSSHSHIRAQADKFSWDHSAQQYLAVYRSLM
jgi:glycosyltransferase involved in cell wall biosynthesis